MARARVPSGYRRLLRLLDEEERDDELDEERDEPMLDEEERDEELMLDEREVVLDERDEELRLERTELELLDEEELLVDLEVDFTEGEADLNPDEERLLLRDEELLTPVEELPRRTLPSLSVEAVRLSESLLEEGEPTFVLGLRSTLLSTLVLSLREEVTVPLPGRADELPGRTTLVELPALDPTTVAPRSVPLLRVPPRRSP